MILDIVTYPAASLKEKCVPVTEITDEIRQLAADMLETMYEAPGVGLAAPQVGRNIRMLVMDPAAQDEEKQPRVVINPELTLSEDTVLSRQEGCLSVPLNYRADVQRAERVQGEPGVSDRDFTSPDQGKSKEKTESCCCVECSGELIDRCLLEQLFHISEK